MRSALAPVFLTTLLAAQMPDGEWNAFLRQRFEAGEDLIDLRYRRDDHGILQVASCEGGWLPYRPMLPVDAAFKPAQNTTRAMAVVMLLAHGGEGLLGNTDAERHLRRAGIEPTPVALRQFLVAPITNVDPVLARVELLDRLVAIDWLQRGRHEGAVAELTALGTRGDTPPLLANRAMLALAAFGRRPAPARLRLAPETLLLPAIADAYVVLDHARMPDFAALPALARRVAVDRSYRVYQLLKAPTPDDLYWGQFRADLAGELPFEVVRRYGNVRLDHTVVAVLLHANDAIKTFLENRPLARPREIPLAWSLQAAGGFEPAQFAAAMEELAEATEIPVKVTRRDGEVHAAAFDGEIAVGEASLRSWTKGMAGRAKPELARELLAEGPAIRIVVPPTSRAWLALAFLELPPAGRAEITVSFGEEFRLCLSLTARDEDAAEQWAERGAKLLAEGLDRLRAAVAGKDAAGLQPVVDAVAATKVATDGARVEAVLTSRTIGWPTLQAIRNAIK